MESFNFHTDFQHRHYYFDFINVKLRVISKKLCPLMLRDESVYSQPRSNMKILSQLKDSAFVVYWSGTLLSQVWALLLTSDCIT